MRSIQRPAHGISGCTGQEAESKSGVPDAADGGAFASTWDLTVTA